MNGEETFLRVWNHENINFCFALEKYHIASPQNFLASIVWKANFMPIVVSYRIFK